MLNSANLETYEQIFRVKGFKLPKRHSAEALSSDDQSRLREALLSYAEKLPRTNSHIRFGLRYLQGEGFVEFLHKYLRPLLIKGVPSVV